ncbi:MAG: SPOR domain-containing protein [Amylibacter sp.]|nr:SPOR domain-containing protein [Amylibacter sp.]
MSKVIFTGKLMKIGLAALVSVSLAACEEGKSPNLFKGKGNGGGLFSKKEGGTGLFGKKTNAATPSQAGSIKLVERDVESPEVFQVTEKALWDGRPSLGGIWVAHPDSDQPERVIIRNKTNGKFVIGALFKRERDNPGPRLQLSSEAASALGVLAGAPTTLNVTVLRRETVAADDGGGSPPIPETVTTEVLKPASTQDVKDTVLKSVAAAEAKKGMAKTVDTKKVDTKKVDIARTTPGKTKSTPTPKVAAPKAVAQKSTYSLALPFIQLGFFSVETNAKNTLKALETRKIPGKVVKATAKGKTFWRVLAGPAQTKGERDAYLNEIKKMGFADAYLAKK